MPIDYKKYPPNWRKEIVPRILKRANNKCEKCGLENHSTIYSVKYKGKSSWFKSFDEANIQPKSFEMSKN